MFNCSGPQCMCINMYTCKLHRCDVCWTRIACILHENWLLVNVVITEEHTFSNCCLTCKIYVTICRLHLLLSMINFITNWQDNKHLNMKLIVTIVSGNQIQYFNLLLLLFSSIQNTWLSFNNVDLVCTSVNKWLFVS